MASLSHAVFGAGTALLFWTCIGLCLTRRLMPPLALPMAPALGWAAYNAIALLIFLVAPFSHATVLALAGSALAIAFATLRGRGKPAPSAVPAWAYALAALLAIVPAAAILPKFGTDAVYLASPIFDHVKVAMIDDMTRLGFPPGNPFFADPEHPRLAYYYLWHFAAAQLALATGISGWEADAAMTWFSAAASLFLMMGLAARIGGGTAAVLAMVVSATRVGAAGACRHSHPESRGCRGWRHRRLAVSGVLGAAAHDGGYLCARGRDADGRTCGPAQRPAGGGARARGRGGISKVLPGSVELPSRSPHRSQRSSFSAAPRPAGVCIFSPH